MRKRMSIVFGVILGMWVLPAMLRGQALDYKPVPLDTNAGFTAFSAPMTAKPPVMDGVISPGEWDQAVLINVMGDQGKAPAWSHLYARWVKWSLMWDADNVYLCAESQRLPNENLYCMFRDPLLGGNVVFDDAIELVMAPGGRNRIGTTLPWMGQAIINPFGVGYYIQCTYAVQARNTAWKPDWKIGSQIHKDSWVFEMTMPRASWDLPQPNKSGDFWSMLMARDWKKTGWNQSSVPTKAASFASQEGFPQVFLTDGAFARLTDVSSLFKGVVAPVIELGTCGSKPETVTVNLLIEQCGATNGAPLLWEKKATVEVVPGKLTAWKPDEQKSLPPGRYRHYLKIMSATSTNPVLESNFFFVPGQDAWLAESTKKLVAESYGFSAELAPTVSKLIAMADFLYAPDKEQVGTLEVKVSRPGDKAPVFSGISSNLHYSMIMDTFQLPTLSPGKYAWSMRLLNKAGKELAAKTGDVEKKDEAKEFPWWNFEGGKTEKVLWPYEALRTADGERLDYWGGTYRLNGLCLPRQLQVTANQEWWPELLRDRPSVLAREVEVSAVQSGKVAQVKLQGFPRTTSVQDWHVGLRGYGQIGETVELQSDSWVEQDGLLWVTLTLRPSVDASTGKDVRRKEVSLDRLTIDIPYREDVARLIVAHGSPGYASHTLGVVPEGTNVVWDTTKIGKSVLYYGDFVSVLWLGNDQRGLVLLMENNQGWAHKDLPDQQVIRQGGEVILRMNVIQEPVTITEDRVIRFGFLPTPMRKMVPGWRMLNCSFSQNFADGGFVGRMVKSGDSYNASVIPACYQKSRMMMFGNTMGMIQRASELAPHTERGQYESISADWPAKTYFGPEWAENSWTPEFQNHLMFNMQKWIDQGGMSGIYHDQFAPHGVLNNLTGAAWRLPDGRINRGYNMLLDRAFNRREYALFLENGIQPRIFCHTTNGGQKSGFPWVTAILDGEDKMVVADADYDFMDLYPSERMQAYGQPWNWGNTFYWMRLIGRGKEDWQKRQDRTYVGWTYLHDVFNNNSFGEAEIWPKLFDWGMNDNDVKFWSYWRNRKFVTCSNPDVLVSMWTLKDRALLCAFNVNRKAPAKATIRIPLADLGLMPAIRSEYIKATDLESGKAVSFDPWNGGLDVNVLPHDFTLLIVRKFAN